METSGRDVRARQYTRRGILAGAAGLVVAALVAAGRADRAHVAYAHETASGWIKPLAAPVLGGQLGTCFDLCALREDGRYRMWFSWRPEHAIAYVESGNGVTWSAPVISLGPDTASDWQAEVNRPSVVKRPGGYHLWYTGQARGRSWIGHATSPDGVQWTCEPRPVFSPAQPWERGAVMCPHVIWDEALGRFRLWYSAGEQYEPDAIGYATSPDGITWERLPAPIFRPDRAQPWERDRVTACQVVPDGNSFLMFYVGFADVDHAAIGLARSPDGVSNWVRHPANPIITPGTSRDAWDRDAVYKPFAVRDGERWLLWYNGRRDRTEQIGLATHDGPALGL
jgi:predicted GH43/DUF377 family glycosyl hydrolase